MKQSAYINWGMCFFILLFIFSPILSKQESVQPGPLYLVAIILPTFFISLSGGIIKPKVIDLYAIFLFVFALLSTFLSDYGNFRIEAIIKYLLFIVFFISTNSFVLSPKQLKFALKSYLSLSLAISILIILSFIFGYPHESSEYYQGRYSIDITGLDKNPNYLTSFYNITFFVLCYIVATVKLDIKKVCVTLFILAMFFYSSFLSGTRAALLLELLIIASLLIISLKGPSKFMVVLFAIIVVAVYFYNIEEINLMISLFLGERDAFGDTGRTSSWGYALKYIMDCPIFGCGHEAWYSICKGTSYLEYLHNIFLELFLDQGIIGVLLVFGMMSTGYRYTKKSDRLFLALFFFSSAIPLCFQNGLCEVGFWRFVIINRLMMNVSITYDGGIVGYLRNTFGSKSNKEKLMLKSGTV